MKLNSYKSISLLSLTALLSPSLRAENSHTEYVDTFSYTLNPVVVTGTGMHQRLKDTPVPVEVITVFSTAPPRERASRVA